MRRRLFNIMEKAVIDMIDDSIASLGCCTCEHCKLDMTAYVLNHVQPKYVVTEQGELFSKVSNLYPEVTVNLLTEITKAAEIVSKNPHHEEQDG